MTRENKKYSIIYAVYKDEEYDCTLCAEAPKLCPYCEGYNPSKPQLDDWIKPFVQSINDRFKREEQ